MAAPPVDRNWDSGGASRPISVTRLPEDGREIRWSSLPKGGRSFTPWSTGRSQGSACGSHDAAMREADVLIVSCRHRDEDGTLILLGLAVVVSGAGPAAAPAAITFPTSELPRAHLRDGPRDDHSKWSATASLSARFYCLILSSRMRLRCGRTRI